MVFNNNEPSTAATQIQPAASEYAFTEFLTFEFSKDAVLEDASTEVGELWAQIIKTLVEHEETDLVWWGRTVEVPEIAKLVIDWKNTNTYQDFHNSPTFQNLDSSWQIHVAKPVVSSRYILPNYKPFRTNALSQFFGSTIATVLLFRFPPDFDKEKATSLVNTTVSQAEAWEYYWRQFTRYAKQSEGAITSTAAGGWSLNLDSQNSAEAGNLEFCGITRWKNLESSRKYFGEAEKLSWTKGGLERLNEMASAGMEIQSVDFLCFEDGWLGNVMENKRPVDFTKSLFGSPGTGT